MAIEDQQMETMRAELLRLQERERLLLADRDALEARLEGLASEVNRWRAVVEHAADGIYVKDREGRYVFANQAAARLSGIPVEQGLGRKDGSSFPAEGIGRPCMYQGRMVRVIAMRDLTETQRLLAELRASEETLRAQNERLTDLDRLKSGFVGAVSHELRTPLTSIKGYAEFLEDQIGGALSPEQLGYVQQILEGSVRLERLVDDLLDFARLEAGAFKLELHSTDLGQKISEVLHSLHPQAQEKQLMLEADVAGMPTLQLDPGRIEQVLINLVGNAIKFSPVGGRVTVRARASAPSGIRVEVADTGFGIAAEHLPHLFDRFYQVDPSTTRKTGGTGLGLSIARALVSAHGGTMGVESEPGKGSTFWFSLPVTAS